MDSSMDIVAEKEGNEKVAEYLSRAGFKKEQIAQYVDLFREHEIDPSILTSNLLNNDLLKDIGITKAGHRAKILSIKLFGLSNVKEGEDFNQKPEEDLTLDEALNVESNEPSFISPIPNLETNISSINDIPLKKQKSEKKQNKFFNGDNIMDEGPSIEEKKSDTVITRQLLLNETLLNRIKYIPLRLTEKERKQLHLLEAALSVSNYTDKVDIISSEKKSKRSFEQLKDMCSILSGLLIASDYPSGQKLVSNRQFHDNKIFFQEVFQVGTEYGKLVYMLQGSALPEIE